VSTPWYRYARGRPSRRGVARREERKPRHEGWRLLLVFSVAGG
jgi:hypothetical protein